MTDKTDDQRGASDIFAELLRSQSAIAQAMTAKLLPSLPTSLPDAADAAKWLGAMGKLQSALTQFAGDQADKAVDATRSPKFANPSDWLMTLGAWYRQMPIGDEATQKRLLESGLDLAQTVLGQFGIGPRAAEPGEDGPEMPRKDRRFADPRWRATPLHALIHQSYLLLSEELLAMADRLEDIDPLRKEQLRFATRVLVDSLSPANFPLTNPVALDRARETQGDSLAKGVEHVLADIQRGQLTHTDPEAFRLGVNIAATPGKVVHETPLYQVIQYTPATATVLATPLVIFPPWINRFYILDLNPKKSFIRWAVEQGISVFVVSWKSADASLAQTTWDDYIRSQIEVIDLVRERLKVPSVHTIGYCVAGTTLAATLAVLARRGEGGKVKSATFFTAQVDFEEPGDLKLFIDDAHMETIRRLSPEGYLDGRYMAATFNMLRDQDLIWDYVVKNYLLGEDYPAFDLLHWNGDVTNLPIRWHQDYLRDLYRDNLLVVPDRLSADGTPIDLRRIEAPAYIQAGREDHIAPPMSVWKFMRYLKGPATFVLAGSGHIAGVVNPPSSGKYQYWINEGSAETLDDFVAGATEHPGSWWPHWLAWLRSQDPAQVKAAGKRKPGGRGDPVIEDAPGRYVMAR